jgi:hypothetical protein
VKLSINTLPPKQKTINYCKATTQAKLLKENEKTSSFWN